MGPVCLSCYVIVLRSPAACARCQQVQPLLAQDEGGGPLCGPCVGFSVEAYTCRRCSAVGNPYKKGLCARCLLRDRLKALLSGPDGVLPQQLQPVMEAFSVVDKPFQALEWVRRSPNARLLGDLAASGEPISHDLLDRLPPDQNVHYVRQLLVHIGVLKERAENLDRVPAWLEHQLTDRPASHARLLRPFLHWHLMRKARQRVRYRSHPADTGRSLRRRVIAAMDLLTWLDEEHLTLAQLAQLAQLDLERWLADGGTPRYLVRHFLDWAHRHHLCGPLIVPQISALPTFGPA
jgi:hypothetical protein